MTYRTTPWADLIRNDPPTARSKILTAYLATRGNAIRAAKHLGISHRSLLRYVSSLDLSADIGSIRAANND